MPTHPDRLISTPRSNHRRHLRLGYPRRRILRVDMFGTAENSSDLLWRNAQALGDQRHVLAALKPDLWDNQFSELFLYLLE
jgi:hypothetical protein